MEVREFRGRFVAQGVETDEMALRVILSEAAGVTSGSGSFALPLALVGWRGEALAFHTEAGAVLRLALREIDPTEGVAYFLTEGPVPEAAGVKVA